MQTPFAALEKRANAAVMARLANATALVGGESVPVIFDLPYDAPFNGEVDAAKPECTGPTALLGGFERGDAISIDGRPYRVERAEPDGTGLTRLVLGESPP